MSLASTSAPLLTSRSTISECPSWQATCSGVLSTLVRASRLMPARSKTSAVCAWPNCAAKCKGDVPSCKTETADMRTEALIERMEPVHIIQHGPSVFLVKLTQSVVNGAPLDINVLTSSVSPRFAASSSLFPKSTNDIYKGINRVSGTRLRVL